jgi:N-methylhydantoinase A
MPKPLRVGVDIGGTFTDMVVHDTVRGTIRTHKVLTTPADPSKGMVQAIEELGRSAEIEFLVHGTTAGLNALLSRTGNRFALVTTEGFRDVVLLGRGANAEIWNLRPQKPAPLVAPEDIRTLRERVRFDGSVEVPLNVEDVASLAAWLEDCDIKSVAVCFLHAHTNPTHERQLKQLLLQTLDDVSIVLSHEVAPELGEFERTSTTVATAYVARSIDAYLKNLVRQLHAGYCTAPLHVMRSSGGICEVAQVVHQPIQTIFSGPAGGVVAVEVLARKLARPNLIGIDIGGTSSDVSLVIDGQRSLSVEEDIGGQVVRMPVVEIHSIGAGGGSIARVETGGLRVGPKSAGARPGPACYGRGGTEPTVTDAQVVLRRIDPGWFLGGRMALDVTAAERAVGGVATRLGLRLEAAAEGIIAVANAKMANAIRTLGVRRGIDPRDFALVAFGGAGPLHGAALAGELGISEVVIPFGTGVLSAWGMLHADIRHDFSAALAGSASDSSVREELTRAIAVLEAKGRALLEEAKIPNGQREYLTTVDMRYTGQEHYVAVDYSPQDDCVAQFHRRYADRYGHSMPQSAVEFVNVRCAAIGRIGVECSGEDRASDSTPMSTREVYIDGAWVDTRIVYRNSMDAEVPGPAIILEDGSTTLVPPDWRVRRAVDGALILSKRPS